MERTILNFYHPLTEAEEGLIESFTADKPFTLLGRQYFLASIDVNHYSTGVNHTTLTLIPVVSK